MTEKKAKKSWIGTNSLKAFILLADRWPTLTLESSLSKCAFSEKSVQSYYQDNDKGKNFEINKIRPGIENLTSGT